MGCDGKIPAAMIEADKDFNPRTPVGCDGVDMSIDWTGNHFNPRTPVGCDKPSIYDTWVKDGISIHAPLRGAT